MVTPRRAPQPPSAGPRITGASVVPFDSSIAGQQASQLGEALSTASRQTYRLSSAMQEDLDEARFNEASSKYADMLSKAERNFDQIRGLDIEGVLDTTRDTLTKQRAEIEKSLTSDRQRQLFKRDADARQRNSFGRMFSHQAEQLRVGRIGKGAAALERSARNRIEAGLKGDVIAYILHTLESGAKLKQLAELQNLSPDQLKLAQEKLEERVTTQVTQGLIDANSVDRARAFADANKSSIGEVMMAKFTAQFDKADRTKDAILAADDLKPQSPVEARRLANERLRSGDFTPDQHATFLQQSNAAIREREHAEDVEKTDLLTQAAELVATSSPMPPKVEQRMRDLGIWFEFERALRTNPDNETTPSGERFLAMILADPTKLDAYSSPEQLFGEWHADLDKDDMNKIASAWQRRLEKRFDNATEALTKGKGASTRSSRFTQNPESRQSFSIDKGRLDEMIYVEMREFAPGIVTKGPSAYIDKPTGDDEDTIENWANFGRLRGAVIERIDSLMAAQDPPLSKPTREIIKQAVSDIVRVGARSGESEKLSFYYGLPTSAQDPSRMVLEFGPGEVVNMTEIPGYTGPDVKRVDNLRLIPTQLAEITETGGDPEAARKLAQQRHMNARGELVEAQLKALMAQDNVTDPTFEQVAHYKARADVMVGELDVYEYMAQDFARIQEAQRMADEQIARRDPVDQALLQYSPMGKGLSIISPDERTVNQATAGIESMWRSWSSTRASRSASETDAEFFVESYRDFEFAFKTRLEDLTKDIPQGTYYQPPGLDPGVRRDMVAPYAIRDRRHANVRQLVDIIFTDAPEELRDLISESAIKRDPNGFRDKLLSEVSVADAYGQKFADAYQEYQILVNELKSIPRNKQEADFGEYSWRRAKAGQQERYLEVRSKVVKAREKLLKIEKRYAERSAMSSYGSLDINSRVYREDEFLMTYPFRSPQKLPDDAIKALSAKYNVNMGSAIR